jgi:hypothetical protein
VPDTAKDTDEVLVVLRGIHAELTDIKRSVSAVNDAFPHNDLGKPDFDGHRQDHLKRMAEAKTMLDYKHSVTKQIISLAVVFLVGLLSSGFVNAIVEKVSK